MVIPSVGTVTDKKDADVTLDLSFTHPMEMQGMPLAKPKAVQVIANGKTEDLKTSLKAKKIVDHDGTPKNVELGAVLWAEFVDPVKK